MGLSAEPAFVRIFRHPLGIPQYVVGHLERLARLEDRLARLPGLHLAGNGYRGVAINSCVAEAGPLAERVLSAKGRGSARA
jgi:oxygen-dependent protoporphyrinogen oxidase